MKPRNRRFWPTSWHRLAQAGVALLVGVLACKSEPASNGTGGAGGTAGNDAAGGEGGTAGAGAWIGCAGGENTDPSLVTSGEDCDYPCGEGGAIAWYCDAVTVQLSEPVPAAGIEVRVDTSLGDSLTCGANCVELQDGFPTEGLLSLRGDPVRSLHLITCCADVYEPAWIDVAVDQDGSPIGSAHFEPLEYSCHAQHKFRWCWEASPVELTVTPTL